jgi:hypothetical protein
MKPVTAQDYAKCYGTFIANINVAETSIPGLIAWFKGNFGEIYTMYLLNKSVFDSYPATVTNIGKPPSTWKPTFKGKNTLGIPPKDYIAYAKGLSYLQSNLYASLKSAMSLAEVIPSLAIDKLKLFAIIFSTQSKKYPIYK